MQRFFKTTILICVCYLSAAMVIAPTACIQAASNALNLCAEVVIPTLFPFFICSNLLISLGAARLMSRYLSKVMHPLFGISGGGALAVVLGLVSGYPVGADCIAGLYRSGCCSRTEAERMLTFCNNSGPLFVMGAIGVGMLGNQKLGIFLYIVHVLSALMTGMLFKKYGKNDRRERGSLPPSIPLQLPFAAVGNAVTDGVNSICKVCGFVLVFAVFTAALPENLLSRIAYAFLEITGGIRGLLKLHALRAYLLPSISFFLALSGISVLLQVAGIILPAGLSLKSYLLGKLTQGTIAFGLTALGMPWLTEVKPVVLAEMPIWAMPDPMGLLFVSLMALAWSLLSIFLAVFGLWLWERMKNQRKNRFRE